MMAGPRFGIVPIPPVPPGELRVVIEHEFIDISYHLKIALPGDVVRLTDSDPFQRLLLQYEPGLSIICHSS